MMSDFYGAVPALPPGPHAGGRARGGARRASSTPDGLEPDEQDVAEGALAEMPVPIRLKEERRHLMHHRGVAREEDTANLKVHLGDGPAGEVADAAFAPNHVRRPGKQDNGAVDHVLVRFDGEGSAGCPCRSPPRSPWPARVWRQPRAAW